MADESKALVAFKSGEVTVTQEEYNTFVASISTQNPTEPEIKIYLFDCARRGVHPLDKLIYFTKRKGRYTPIVGIDYMRMRAESSGVYAGSDDAKFTGELEIANKKYPAQATVTVHKLVNGERCPFTATARWVEYSPDLSDTGSFMWKKMPHTMLSKCAEALALRKAFPGQLHGLYINEEMDQAGVIEGEIVKPSPKESTVATTQTTTAAQPVVQDASVEMVTLSDGKTQKPADEKISIKAIQSFEDTYVGKDKFFTAKAHLKNHLRKHFQVDTLPEMTWGKFMPLVAHVKGTDDPKYYPAEPQNPAIDVSYLQKMADSLGIDLTVLFDVAHINIPLGNLTVDQLATVASIFETAIPDPIPADDLDNLTHVLQEVLNG